jgi:hypothetical protein
MKLQLEMNLDSGGHVTIEANNITPEDSVNILASLTTILENVEEEEEEEYEE